MKTLLMLALGFTSLCAFLLAIALSRAASMADTKRLSLLQSTKQNTTTSLMISLMPNPEKDEHDKNVKDLSNDTLKAAAKDLYNRKVHDRRNPEHRWILERRAALLRELERRRIRL